MVSESAEGHLCGFYGICVLKRTPCLAHALRSCASSVVYCTPCCDWVLRRELRCDIGAELHWCRARCTVGRVGLRRGVARRLVDVK